MITLLFIFIAVVLVVLKTIWDYTSSLLIFLFLILSIWTIIRLVRRIKQYGSKNVFRVFHKQQKSNDEDHIHYMLSKFGGSMIPMDGYYLYIHTSGIYLFKYIKENGTIIGGAEEETWYLQEGKKRTSMKNPCFKFLKKKDELEIFLQKPIRIYFILNYHTLLAVPIDRKFHVVRIQNLYYQLEKYMKDKKYTEEQLDMMLKVVVK